MTPRIEILMKRELSYGMLYLTPCGKVLGQRGHARLDGLGGGSSALPLGASWTPMPVDGSPFRRADVA